MTIALKGLRGKVVIRKDKPAATTSGGIIIPESCREKPITGEVLSVGPGEISPEGYRQPTDIKAGDGILFHKYSGLNVTLDGEEFYIIPAKDCLATFDII
jgi:chaperonin GroES